MINRSVDIESSTSCRPCYFFGAFRWSPRATPTGRRGGVRQDIRSYPIRQAEFLSNASLRSSGKLAGCRSEFASSLREAYNLLIAKWNAATDSSADLAL